jgi:Spy/CpxP family protein refolding chaperone
MQQFTLTLILATAALFAVPSTTFGQEKPAGDRPQRPEGARRMDPEARLKFLTEKLELNADQQAKIKEIMAKNAPKMKAFMDKGRDNLTDADKTEISALMKSQGEEINAVLTPAQQEKMKALRPQRRDGAKPAEPKPADK